MSYMDKVKAGKGLIYSALAVAILIGAFTMTWQGPSQAGGQAKCKGVNATIVGSNNSQEINGTSNRDVIVGRGGNDDIDGRGGNDLICGGSGNDELDGEAGSDRIHGAGGNDDLDGGAGNDRLNGGRGRDEGDGDAGNDTCRRIEFRESC